MPTPDEIELDELLKKLQQDWPEIWKELKELFELMRDPKYAGPALVKLAQLIARAFGAVPNVARVLLRRIIILIFRIRGLPAPLEELGLAEGATVSVLAVPVAPAVAVVAILLALAVFGYIGYRLATTPVVQPTSGVPCGRTTGPSAAAATTKQSTTVRAIGGHRSWNQAIEAAESVCSAKFAGGCRAPCGKGTCKPNVSVQEFDQSWGLFWTTTDLTFFCPCECL